MSQGMNPPQSGGAQDIFEVTCSKGHVTYFNKWRVCPASGTVMRDYVQRGGKQLDVLYLRCSECGEEIVVEVDCEGYV